MVSLFLDWLISKHQHNYIDFSHSVSKVLERKWSQFLSYVFCFVLCHMLALYTMSTFTSFLCTVINSSVRFNFSFLRLIILSEVCMHLNVVYFCFLSFFFFLISKLESSSKAVFRQHLL